MNIENKQRVAELLKELAELENKQKVLGQINSYAFTIDIKATVRGTFLRTELKEPAINCTQYNKLFIESVNKRIDDIKNELVKL